MASGLLNMIAYWLFFLSSVIMVMSLFVEAGQRQGWTIYPPLALPQAQPGSGTGMTLWLVSAYFYSIFLAQFLELYCYC